MTYHYADHGSDVSGNGTRGQPMQSRTAALMFSADVAYVPRRDAFSWRSLLRTLILGS